MPDTGSPPGPPEPAGTQPWPGFDKFSAVQVGRPSPRGDPDVPATVHRRQTAPYTPSRENRRAREAPERRARPPRAPSTRRLPVKKAPPFSLFCALFYPARSTRGDVGADLIRFFHVRSQGILDRNHALIAEIDQNHASRYPEGLQRNVVLIRELNENLTKVGDLYEELSGAFMQRVSSAQSVNPENRNNGDEAGWETVEREAA